MKFKKILSNALLVLTFIMFLSPPVFGHDQPEIRLSVNGSQLENMQLAPVILDGYVMVSAREVFEPMGVVVDWDPISNSVYIQYNQDIITLDVNNSLANFNGESLQMDIDAKIINGEPMIPLLFVSDILGFNVLWNEDTNEIHIDNNINQDINRHNQKPAMNFGQARITDIYIPEPTEKHTFVIESLSEISSFEYYFIEDGRIVIDIHNSVMDLPSTQYTVEDSPNVSLIRISQSEDEEGVQVTRVVIELSLLSSIYTISMSENRKSINVHFEENLINNISINTYDDVDYITITGSRNPDIHISNIYEENNLIIDIHNGMLDNLDRPSLNGNFIKGGYIWQVDYNTVRISLNLDKAISYSLLSDGNSITVVIEDPTFRNMTFDRENNALVLRQTTNLPIDIDSIVYGYDDYQSGYIIILPGNYSNFFGYGNIEIRNEFIDFIEVLTETSRTTITIDQNRIIALDVVENNGNIYMYIICPKDKYEKIVMLDPGHGGHDSGAVYFDVMEKDLSLTISNMTKEMFEQNESIKVYATRTTDVFVPLTERAKLANDAADLFVSIHLNSFPYLETVRGTETYYLAHETDEYFDITRREVAEIFQRNLVEGLGTVDRGVKTENFSVLKNTTIPSVLLELGFLSNLEENLMFSDPFIQQKTAQIIYESIVEIFEIYTPPR